MALIPFSDNGIDFRFFTQECNSSFPADEISLLPEKVSCDTALADSQLMLG
ncbi:MULTISPECIES: hypothetical protein [unclassified Brenneria]|uniref:hypothetical protein n=1 Tax=unclassified Brenneria TaxID=2634434 RepID=UPI001553C952|nr:MULTISPECIES: hypothetical protein [unclassified Brenneria]MBJ7223456.1 hypothetical protein [Brenneria sp. L3-3C-1]MEE3644696.1 hypothetical protein [Brenneria sp. L3_3C_1]MEE3652671.1 hypothetical protein [Brenneria sp. HEZEL_4_2_4]NPD02629.1 hypothetical protein [Brenneria sp. hezel4-2-4]